MCLFLHLPQVCVNRNGTDETYGSQGSVAYTFQPERKAVLLIISSGVTRHSRYYVYTGSLWSGLTGRLHTHLLLKLSMTRHSSICVGEWWRGLFRKGSSPDASAFVFFQCQRMYYVCFVYSQV